MIQLDTLFDTRNNVTQPVDIKTLCRDERTSCFALSVVGPFYFQLLTQNTSLAVVLHLPVVSLDAPTLFLDDTNEEKSLCPLSAGRIEKPLLR